MRAAAELWTGYADTLATALREMIVTDAAGDLNFCVPLARCGLAQSAHQIVLHYWFDQYLDRHGQGAA